LAKQSLGQNFLVDPNLVEKLLDALAPGPAEPVLEIGAGTGAITEPLLRRSSNVCVVEIDQRLLPLLRERIGDRATVLHANILEVNLTTLAQERGGRLAVTGNLPYYLSSPILFHLIAHRQALSRAVVTLQDEVAARACAGPGSKDYGSLSIQLSLFAPPRRLFTLARGAFRPQPKITSAAVLLDFAHPAADAPEDASSLERVLRAAFGQRRKMLRNALASSLGAAAVDRVLAVAELDGRVRAEQLAPADFVRLTDALRRLANGA
jgi:16S rRNA (adenine1518-N6/adenine1519-N6)-dimethyltransferase